MDDSGNNVNINNNNVGNDRHANHLCCVTIKSSHFLRTCKHVSHNCQLHGTTLHGALARMSKTASDVLPSLQLDMTGLVNTLNKHHAIIKQLFSYNSKAWWET
jgi:hypothetical protein